VKTSLARRFGGVERARAGQRRDRYLWKKADETDEMVDARIEAMIARGEASRNDRFVIFSWRSKADHDAET
jgi:hypothetical protein